MVIGTPEVPPKRSVSVIVPGAAMLPPSVTGVSSRMAMSPAWVEMFPSVAIALAWVSSATPLPALAFSVAPPLVSRLPVWTMPPVLTRSSEVPANATWPSDKVAAWVALPSPPMTSDGATIIARPVSVCAVATLLNVEIATPDVASTAIPEPGPKPSAFACSSTPPPEATAGWLLRVPGLMVIVAAPSVSRAGPVTRTGPSTVSGVAAALMSVNAPAEVRPPSVPIWLPWSSVAPPTVPVRKPAETLAFAACVTMPALSSSSVVPLPKPAAVVNTMPAVVASPARKVAAAMLPTAPSVSVPPLVNGVSPTVLPASLMAPVRLKLFAASTTLPELGLMVPEIASVGLLSVTSPAALVETGPATCSACAAPLLAMLMGPPALRLPIVAMVLLARAIESPPPACPVSVASDTAPAVCVTAPELCKSSVPIWVAFAAPLMVIEAASPVPPSAALRPRRSVPAAIADRSPGRIPPVPPPMLTIVVALASGPISIRPVPPADSKPAAVIEKSLLAMDKVWPSPTLTAPATDNVASTSVARPVTAKPPMLAMALAAVSDTSPEMPPLLSSVAVAMPPAVCVMPVAAARSSEVGACTNAPSPMVPPLLRVMVSADSAPVTFSDPAVVSNRLAALPLAPLETVTGPTAAIRLFALPSVNAPTMPPALVSDAVPMLPAPACVTAPDAVRSRLAEAAMSAAMPMVPALFRVTAVAASAPTTSRLVAVRTTRLEMLPGRAPDIAPNVTMRLEPLSSTMAPPMAPSVVRTGVPTTAPAACVAPTIASSSEPVVTMLEPVPIDSAPVLSSDTAWPDNAAPAPMPMPPPSDSRSSVANAEASNAPVTVRPDAEVTLPARPMRNVVAMMLGRSLPSNSAPLPAPIVAALAAPCGATSTVPLLAVSEPPAKRREGAITEITPPLATETAPSTLSPCVSAMARIVPATTMPPSAWMLSWPWSRCTSPPSPPVLSSSAAWMLPVPSLSVPPVDRSTVLPWTRPEMVRPPLVATVMLPAPCREDRLPSACMALAAFARMIGPPARPLRLARRSVPAAPWLSVPVAITSSDAAVIGALTASVPWALSDTDCPAALNAPPTVRPPLSKMLTAPTAVTASRVENTFPVPSRLTAPPADAPMSAAVSVLAVDSPMVPVVVSCSEPAATLAAVAPPKPMPSVPASSSSDFAPASKVPSTLMPLAVVTPPAAPMRNSPVVMRARSALWISGFAAPEPSVTDPTACGANSTVPPGAASEPAGLDVPAAANSNAGAFSAMACPLPTETAPAMVSVPVVATARLPAVTAIDPSAAMRLPPVSATSPVMPPALANDAVVTTPPVCDTPPRVVERSSCVAAVTDAPMPIPPPLASATVFAVSAPATCNEVVVVTARLPAVTVIGPRPVMWLAALVSVNAPVTPLALVRLAVVMVPAPACATPPPALTSSTPAALMSALMAMPPVAARMTWLASSVLPTVIAPRLTWPLAATEPAVIVMTPAAPVPSVATLPPMVMFAPAVKVMAPDEAMAAAVSVPDAPGTSMSLPASSTSPFLLTSATPLSTVMLPAALTVTLAVRPAAVMSAS